MAPIYRFIVVFISLFFVFKQDSKAQCVAFINQIGDTVNNPTFTNCIVGATPANVNLSFQIASTLNHPFTINWGDGNTTNSTVTLVAGSILTHTYTAAIDTYLIQINQTLPACIAQAHFVNERSVIAQIAPLVGSVTTVCAPGQIRFSNNSTNVSKTTIFEVDYGDGTPADTFNFNNYSNVITHTYQRNVVNCNTVVTLTARNSCTGSVVSTNTYGPIAVYDLDSAIVGVNNPIHCYPDTTFIFTNNTIRNCVNDGNTAQRFEKWRIQGNGLDTTIDWRPWPPSQALTFNFRAATRPISYTVTLLDSSFCGIDTTSRIVTIIDAPIASFLSVDTICSGDVMTFTNTSSGTFNNRNWDFGDGGTSNNNNPNYTFTNLTSSPITRNVRLIINNTNGASCRDTVFKNVVVLPQPTARFIMNTEAINDNSISGCDSLLINFVDTSLNAFTYLWDFDNNGTIDFTGKSPSARKFYSSSTIRLRVITTNGCDHEITKNVIIYRTPIAAYSTASVCVNQLASFVDTSIAFTGNTISSRVWNFGDPASGIANTSTIINPTHTYTTPGIYDVRLIINSINGCSDTITKQLNVQFPPSIDFNPSLISGCSPLAVNFTNTTTGADPNKYIWKVKDSLFSNQVSPSRIFINNKSTNDTIIIKLVAESAFGCRDSITKTIIVFPNPIAAFSANTLPTCNYSPISFINTSSQATRFYWDFGDGDTSILPNPIHQFTNNSNQIRSYIITMIAFNINDCSDTVTLPIVVYPNQTFNLQTNIDSGCSPLNVQFPAFPAVVSYQWDFGDSQQSNLPAPAHTYTNISSNIIEYTARGILTNAFGCLDTVYKTFKVSPVPDAIFNTNINAGCEPLIVTFNNNSLNFQSCTWDFGDGTLSTNSNSSFNKIYTNTSSFPIERNIKLKVVNTQGCEDSLIQSITVYPALQSNFELSDSVGCSPLNITTNNLSVNANRYRWYIDANLVDTNFIANFNIINNTNVDRIANIRLEVISEFGCTKEFQRNVRILPIPRADFLVSNPVIQYPLSTFNLINQNIQAGFNYNWSFGDGNTSTNPNLSSYTYAIPGTYTIQLIVSNSQCSDTLTQVVSIQPPVPIASFNGTATGCLPLTVAFKNNSQFANQFNWDFGDGNQSSEENPVHVYTTPGIYNVTLTAKGEGGQTITVKIDSINVYANPIAYFVAQPNVVYIPSDPVVLYNLSTGSSQYFWDFGDGFTSTEMSPEHYYTKVGEYTITLIVRNDLGCYDTVTAVNIVKAESSGKIVIPNAFTPNPNGSNGGIISSNDFSNDVFHPVINGAEKYKLSIYNRWGELLFESNDVNVGWDGYYRNELCKQDVYIWKVEVLFSDGTKQSKSGDVLLLR